MRTILLSFLILTLTACQGLTSPATPTASATPTPTQTGTATPSETPKPARAVLLSEMNTVEDCAQNSLDLHAPDFQKKLDAMFASIDAQFPSKEIKSYYQVAAGSSYGTFMDFYHLASIYWKSAEGNLPIVACGQIRSGDAVGTVYIMQNFPFPTADGKFEPIDFGFVIEDAAEQRLATASDPIFYNERRSESVLFPTFKLGPVFQTRLDFFIDSFVNRPSNDPSKINQQEYIQKLINTYQAILGPELFNQL